MESTSITTLQRNRIFALLNKLHLLDARSEIILAHSNGRTASVAKLEEGEADSVISFLSAAATRTSTPTIEKQRLKLLALFHELGWHKLHAETGQPMLLPDGRRKLDYDRINAWCKKHTPTHKEFNEMNGLELASTVTIVQRMVKTYNK